MKRVIVTGSSRGIGKAVALDLARNGYDPVLHCVKNKDAAEAVAQELRALGLTGDILQFDIADRAIAEKELSSWVAENGAPYAVVLNAGIADDAPFPGMEGDQWDRVIRTDLDGFYNVLKPLVLPMVQARAKGRIVAISSISGVIGNRGQTNYSAAKAGLIGACKALAVELAKRKITVNCVAPGVIETELTRRLGSTVDSDKVPMGRMGQPAEVAEAVVFLASDMASYISGQNIRVNGGQFML
jgi:3-oxoacyl-[acyl-carrier protein] reductase